MRVALVSNGEFYAGAERVQDILAIELSRLGCEITFVLLKPNQFDRVRRSRTVPVVTLPMAGRADLRVASRLASLLRQGDFHLMHAHEPRSLLVAATAAQLSGVPFLYHVHSRVGMKRRCAGATSPTQESSGCSCLVRARLSVLRKVSRIVLPG